jgi:hypothetical protein
VTLIGHNQIGTSLRTAATNGTRLPHTTDQVPGKRSAGSLSWGGINNTFFRIRAFCRFAGFVPNPDSAGRD